MFVPDGVIEKQNAINIIAQQLDIKAASKFARSAPIYFAMTGYNATRDILHMCGRRPCNVMKYAKEGDESLTLGPLFDYCTTHPEAMVTYLHDKGTFNPSGRNELLRIMLNKAIFSDECQTIPMGQCNICSARFSPLPYFHMPGNMWTAHCSYIRELVDPRKFSDRMDDLVDYVLSKNDTIIPKPTDFQIRTQHMVGKDTFYVHVTT